MAARTWFLDFEGYTEPGKYWVKELCILPYGKPEDAGFDQDEHYNYFVKSDGLKGKRFGPQSWQLRRHGLEVYFGDYEYDEVIRDVQLKVGKGKVLVKGREKANFLKPWFNVEELPEHLCTFKKCQGFMDKCCQVKHGKEFCAKRKCYILRDAYERYNNQACKLTCK